MKKLSKILILVLSLAVVLTTLVIVASADTGNVAKVGTKEYATIDEALEAVSAGGGEIVLLDDASMDNSVSIAKSVTINLAGNTLTACSDAFAVAPGGTLTVTGEGTVVADTNFVTTAVTDEKTQSVKIIGTDSGIDIVASGVLVKAGSGTFNFKNLNVVDDVVTGNHAIFETVDKADAKLNFTAVEATLTEGVNNYSSIVRLLGTASVKTNYCTFTSNRVVFGFGAYDGKDVAIEADNSYFSSRTPAASGNKNHELGVIGTYATVSCQMIFNNSVIESSFRPICLNATSEAMVVLNNSAIRQNGITNGMIARTCSITVNSGSSLTSSAVLSTMQHENCEADGTYIILMPGARMNKGVYDTIFESGHTEGMRYGELVTLEDETTSLELSLIPENEKFTVIYDPIGNRNAPYVVVKRTYETDAGGNTVETTPSGASIPENIYYQDFNDIPGGVMWDNGQNGPSYSAAFLPVKAFLGWNKNGILSGVHYADNGAIRLENDELNASANNTTLVFGDGKGYAHNEYQVFVAEADIAFDSPLGILASTMAICARGENNGGDYASTKISFTTDGKATVGSTSVDVSTTGWNHLTVVVYSDKGVTGTSCKGAAHYYLNGEYLGKSSAYNVKGSNGNVAYLWGLRCDISASASAIGSSVVFDNVRYATYTDYIGSEADDPIIYSENAGMPVNVGVPTNAITIGGRSFNSINEAIEAGKDLGVSPILKGSVSNQLVTVDGTVYTKGNSIGITEGSNSAMIKYYDDGQLKSYTFNAGYNDLYATYKWFVGNKNNKDELWDDSKYVETQVPLGYVPEYDGEALPVLTEHIGQKIFVTEHIGWSSDPFAETPENLNALSLSDAINLAGSSVKLFPVYTKREVTGYSVIVLDENGNFKRGVNPPSNVYGSDWYRADKPNGIWLEYGETFVLMTSNITWVGSFQSPRAATGVDKVFSFDLNGYEMKIDGAKNSGGKSPNFFQAYKGETINFYSSVPGAKVIAQGTNEAATSPVGSNIFQMYGCSSSSSGHTHTIEENTGDTAQNTNINIGTVTRFGKTYDGSNLTFEGDCLVDMPSGDATCKVNVEGITFIKSFTGKGYVFSSSYYNGSLDVKNCNFFFPNGKQLITGYNSGLSDYNGDGSKNEKDVQQAESEGAVGYRTAAKCAFDGCYIFYKTNSTTSAESLVGNDYTLKSVIFTNCVTNARINPSNTGMAVRIGDGCLVYNPSATKLDGVTSYSYNRDMTFGTYTDAETVTVRYVTGVSMINNNKTNVTYSYDEFTFALPGSNAAADLVLPFFAIKFVSADNTHTVTYVDENGSELAKQTYADGAKIIAPEFEPALSGNVVSLVFDGKFTTEAPESVEEDITLTPVYVTVANVTGLKSNLSLHADFILNLMLPAEYKNYVVSIVSGGEELEIKDTAVEGVSYVVVSVPVFAKDAGKDVVFDIALSENGLDYTKTVTYSVVGYAEELLGGGDYDYTEEDETLLWYAMNYANEAALYFNGEEDEKLAAFLDAHSYMTDVIPELEYENVIESTGLSSVFGMVNMKLDETPKFVFTVKAGFAGTVTITTSKGDYTFTVEASDADTKLIVEGLKAYELAETLNIKVAGTLGEEQIAIENGQMNLATFANYHSVNAETSEASAAVCDLLYALYGYVSYSVNFK